MKRLWVRVSIIISSFVLITLLTIGMTSLYWGRMPPMAMSDREIMHIRAPNHMVITFAVIGLVGVGVGVWIGRGISRPIADIANAAQRLGSGNLSVRVNTKTHSQELTELARAFNKMAEELEHAEKLRNNLMADISHELRGPLTVLEGNLRAALDNVVELDEKELANLYGQTRHLIRLVNDLRELALAEAGHLPLNHHPVDVNTLINEVIWNYALTAEEKGVTLSNELDCHLAPLETDEVRLRQILSNLLSNAIRHTPAGGRITVQSTQNQHHVILQVSDTGEGIDAVHLPYLFDRFYRTDKSRQRETGGSGLGLAIVKALTESMGGTVSGTSPGINQGSTFSIVLPKKVAATPLIP